MKRREQRDYDPKRVEQYVTATPAGVALPAARAGELPPVAQDWDTLRRFVREHPRTRLEVLARLRLRSEPAAEGWDGVVIVVALGALAVALETVAASILEPIGGAAVWAAITTVLVSVGALLVHYAARRARPSRRWRDQLELAQADAERNPTLWR